MISLNQIDRSNKTAYVGYWLGEAYQGRGLATQAVNMLIDEFGRSGDIHRFVIKCVVSNEASNGVARRCGFVHEGVLRQAEIIGDQAYDQNIYSYLYQQSMVLH